MKSTCLAHSPTMPHLRSPASHRSRSGSWHPAAHWRPAPRHQPGRCRASGRRTTCRSSAGSCASWDGGLGREAEVPSCSVETLREKLGVPDCLAIIWRQRRRDPLSPALASRASAVAPGIRYPKRSATSAGLRHTPGPCFSKKTFRPLVVPDAPMCTIASKLASS